jgi:hypothetical protein
MVVLVGLGFNQAPGPAGLAHSREHLLAGFIGRFSRQPYLFAAVGALHGQAE